MCVHTLTLIYSLSHTPSVIHSHMTLSILHHKGQPEMSTELQVTVQVIHASLSFTAPTWRQAIPRELKNTLQTHASGFVFLRNALLFLTPHSRLTPQSELWTAMKLWSRRPSFWSLPISGPKFPQGRQQHGLQVLRFHDTHSRISQDYHNNSFPSGSGVKNPPATQETQETWVQSPSWEDPLQEGMVTQLQYSCLENPKDRGA